MTMEEIDLEKVESFFNVHDRWFSPWWDNIKENPDSYAGLVIIDTHTNNGNAASMVTPRVLDDIEQIGMKIDEICKVGGNDGLYEDIEGVQEGHIVLRLRPDSRTPRITPRTDLKREEIPATTPYR